jgi:hypothetical protein
VHSALKGRNTLAQGVEASASSPGLTWMKEIVCHRKDHNNMQTIWHADAKYQQRTLPSPRPSLCLNCDLFDFNDSY